LKRVLTERIQSALDEFEGEHAQQRSHTLYSGLEKMLGKVDPD
jgi:hypothetical protein